MFQYSVILQWSDEDGGYIALIPELPGVSAFGETPEEASREVQEAASLCTETMEEDGEALPEPKEISNYSGQLRIRIPRSLHSNLALLAEMEGISLNSYIIHLLSQNTGIETYKNIKPELTPKKQASKGPTLKVVEPIPEDDHPSQFSQEIGNQAIEAGVR